MRKTQKQVNNIFGRIENVHSSQQLIAMHFRWIYFNQRCFDIFSILYCHCIRTARSTTIIPHSSVCISCAVHFSFPRTLTNLSSVCVFHNRQRAFQSNTANRLHISCVPHIDAPTIIDEHATCSHAAMQPLVHLRRGGSGSQSACVCVHFPMGRCEPTKQCRGNMYYYEHRNKLYASNTYVCTVPWVHCNNDHIWRAMHNAYEHNTHTSYVHHHTIAVTKIISWYALRKTLFLE